MTATSAAAPGRDCPLCPRLAGFRDELRQDEPDWHNAPVPAFGDPDARLLIVGLAPGMKGANRTGRPFTGDFAGDLLYATLIKFGFAKGAYLARHDDGLVLTRARITNAVKCLPPQNKPIGAEINACRPFLKAEIEELDNLTALLALGRIAHDSVVRTLGGRLKDHTFAHGARHRLTTGLTLFDSYHCSRYNTNTGRLTPAMFEQVFAAIRETL
ncbi:MAG: uracil-DNA glycosylase [Sphingomonadales bacterium]|nr:uracil-DNA glycosylase [Sphingomonadales bacterium]